MKMIRNSKLRKFLWISYLAVLPILVIIILYFFGFNLGSVFSDANVIAVGYENLNQEKSINDYFANLKGFEKVIITEDQLIFYYQDIDLDNLQSSIDNANDDVMFSSANILYIGGEEGFLIQERAISTLVFVLLLMILISSIVYRGRNLLRYEVVYLILIDLGLFLHMVLINLGLFSLMQFLGISIQRYDLIMLVLNIIVWFLLHFLIQYRFAKPVPESKIKSQNLWMKAVDQTREMLPVLIIAIVFIFYLPLLTLTREFSVVIVVLFIVILVGIVNIYILKAKLLGKTDRIEKKRKIFGNINYLKKVW